jgi:hypothetical protein
MLNPSFPSPWRTALGVALAATIALAASSAGAATRSVKIAFIADQGLGPDSEAVLQLILDEGADAVVHSGDFDYEDDPAGWDDQINRILGESFPYFASVGNHDDAFVSGDDESGAYQQFMVARMNRLGIPWEGVLGVKSSLYFDGIFILLTAPELFGDGDDEHAPYIRDQLAADDSIWRISSWHYNMQTMQVGGKGDRSGWGVYEASRAGGAIIATGHEHSYSRTHLLSSCEFQEVASEDNTLVLASDDPMTPADEGRSFVFVSGLGGQSVRDQELTGDWWASIYTEDQGATHGALFGEFNYDGDPRRAYFYFKDIAGNVPDEFFVESTMGSDPEPIARPVRKCFDARGKSFLKVAKTQGKVVQTCLKAKAGGKLAGPLLGCFEADPKGKLAKAMARSEKTQSRVCSDGTVDDGLIDAETVNRAASEAGIAVARHWLGPDLDAPIAPKTDRLTSRCQQAVARATDKCHQAKLVAYQRCKRDVLRDGSVPSARDLDVCIDQAQNRKVAKACGDRLNRTLEKKCSGVDLSDSFPGCDSDDPTALGECLRGGIAEQSCLALGVADGLAEPLSGFPERCTTRGL